MKFLLLLDFALLITAFIVHLLVKIIIWFIIIFAWVIKFLFVALFIVWELFFGDILRT